MDHCPEVRFPAAPSLSTRPPLSTLYSVQTLIKEFLLLLLLPLPTAPPIHHNNLLALSTMPIPKSDYISNDWRDGLFLNKVVFCTGGAGTICSAQVRALVYLGANACIVGRNVEKTETAAKDIATARPGAKVIGVGGVDVRKFDGLRDAADRCASELGGIDFVIAGAAGNFLASINQLSVNAFKSVMDIDVLGSYNTFKATAPYLVESAEDCRVDSQTREHFSSSSSASSSSPSSI